MGIVDRIILRIRLKKLLQMWMEYRVLVLSYEGQPAPTALAERGFIGLKGELAFRLESLRALLPKEGAEVDNRGIDEIIELLKDRRPAASGLDIAPAWNMEEFKRIWQEHFINLSRLKGMPLGVSPGRSGSAGSKMPGAQGDRKPKVRRMLIIRPLSIGTLMVAGGLVIVAARAMGLKREGSGFTVDKPENIEELMRNGTAILSGIWGNIQGFLEPIVLNYGPVWTAVMLGLLLTAFGYLALAHR